VANKIWHAGNLNEANWFINNSSHAGTLHFIPMEIPKPGSAAFLNLPEPMKNILRLDAPDLIVTIEIAGVDTPVVVLELTTTTPQSQHAKQRMPRLVAAAEALVPSIYIIPRCKRSGGTLYSLGPDVHFFQEKIYTYTNVPSLQYDWPDSNGGLLNDLTYPNEPRSTEPSIIKAFQVIEEFINERLAAMNAADYIRRLGVNGLLTAELTLQSTAARAATVAVGNFPTLVEINTADLAAFMTTNTGMAVNHINNTLSRIPERIKKRDRTIIFQPSGRILGHAGDPYTGMLAFFDYCFCRFGANIEERNKNLVLMPMNPALNTISTHYASDGYHHYWENKCPFRNPTTPTINEQFKLSHNLQYGCVFTKIKPLRIHGYFSDMIIFQDSVLVF